MLAQSALGEIKAVGFDVDGVLTDGRVIIHSDGSESKHFHSRDGHGLKLLRQAGLLLFIITGRRSSVVEIRARDLGIEEVHQKAVDKLAVFEDILARHGLEPRQTAFAGDDLIDLPILRRAGLAMAPADACPEVLAEADFVASAAGGHGAARQMAEYILKGQGRWPELMARYLR